MFKCLMTLMTENSKTLISREQALLFASLLFYQAKPVPCQLAEIHLQNFWADSTLIFGYNSNLAGVDSLPPTLSAYVAEHFVSGLCLVC